MWESFVQRLDHYNPNNKVKVLDFNYALEPTINYALPLRLSLVRVFLFTLASIFSLGFVFLLSKWSNRILALLIYKVCSVQNATHFLIQDQNAGVREVVQKTKKTHIHTHFQHIHFLYLFRSYLFHPEKEAFFPVRYEDLGIHLEQIRNSNFESISSNHRSELANYFGMNEVRFPLPSIFQLFLDELTTPYEIFQLYSIILWLSQGYYIFPIILLTLTLYIHINTAKQIATRNQRLAKDTYFSFPVTVLEQQLRPIERPNFDTNSQDGLKEENGALDSNVVKKYQKTRYGTQVYETVISDSRQLVPGDIVLLSAGSIVPADCIILEGSALVNLTWDVGVSYLINKKSMENYIYTMDEKRNFQLQMGTSIIRVQSDTDDEISQAAARLVCMVINTGFNSHCGKYTRAILYPNQKPDRFKKESLYVMAVLFIISTIVFIIKVAFLQKYMDNWAALMMFLNDLAIAIPPTLPTVLSVGMSFSLHRLRLKQINCTLPTNVLAAGSVDTIIFSGEQIFGSNYELQGMMVSQPLTCYTGKFFKSMSQVLLENVRLNQGSSQGQAHESEHEMIRLMVHAMASCNNIEFFKGQIEGSPIEKAIYEFTGSTATGKSCITSLQDQIKVLKKVNFRADKDRQAVLVKIIKNSKNGGPITQSEEVFIKGTPERILPLCDPKTLPSNLINYTFEMAEKEFKIICYAHRPVQEGINPCEFSLNNPNLQFLGFALLKKPHKPDQIESIKRLIQSKVKVIYVSQESELTTNAEAIASGIADKSCLLSCSLSEKRNKVLMRGPVEWESTTLEHITEFITEVTELETNYQLALTGPLYEEALMKQERSPKIDSMLRILSMCRIKQEIDLLRLAKKQGQGVMGIGTDQRIAGDYDVTYSLDREFSNQLNSCYTHGKSLESIIELLRICRAGLSTNYQCFSMTVQFSLVQFITVSILQLNYQQFTNEQNLFEDFFIMLPIFLTINLTKPADVLSNYPPRSSVFSRHSLLSMLGQTLIQLSAQIGLISYLLRINAIQEEKDTARQEFASTGELKSKTHLCLCMFVMTNFIYLGVFLSTSVAKPFRKAFYTNIYYTANLVGLWIYAMVVVFRPELAWKALQPGRHHGLENELVFSMFVGNIAMIVMYAYQLVLLWVTNRWIVKRKFMSSHYILSQTNQ